MTLLLDSSLWIDFTRARSPLALKQFIAPFVLDPAAHLAEPVRHVALSAHAARPLAAGDCPGPGLSCHRPHGVEPRPAGGHRGAQRLQRPG